VYLVSAMDIQMSATSTLESASIANTTRMEITVNFVMKGITETQQREILTTVSSVLALDLTSPTTLPHHVKSVRTDFKCLASVNMDMVREFLILFLSRLIILISFLNIFQ